MDYKLKLKSKRLKSGKCQIQFFVTSNDVQTCYGYLLAEAGTTLKEVVGKIEKEVRIKEFTGLSNDHLFNLANKKTRDQSVLIFNN